MALYKVLKDGIRQRSPEGGEFTRPTVGEIIKVSDKAAPRLLKSGWIEAHEGSDRKDKERKAKRSFLGSLGKKGEAAEAPTTGDAPEGDAPEEA